MAGVAELKGRCGLFFVDGHGDFRTPATSSTGEPADMELAALTGRAPNPLVRSTAPQLHDEDILACGVREYDGIDNTPIRLIDCSRLRSGPIATIVREHAGTISPSLPVWLHFDVDVIDADLMPVIYPAGAGLTLSQTTALLRALLGVGHVVGMDVACFHPNLDRAGTATAGLVDLLAELLGGG
jgi:arginase